MVELEWMEFMSSNLWKIISISKKNLFKSNTKIFWSSLSWFRLSRRIMFNDELFNILIIIDSFIMDRFVHSFPLFNWKKKTILKFLDWTFCSKSCGGGIQERKRIRFNSDENSNQCLNETRRCNEFSCPSSLKLF